MSTYFWIAFFIIVPILIMHLCKKYAFLDKIGSVVLCYAAGIIIGNIHILPAGIYKIQDTFLTLTIPIALPLLFFSVDIKKWSRLAGKSTISFFSATIAVIISSSTAFYLFKETLGDASYKVAGMLIGCYTGGTPNLASIGTALNVDPTTYIAVHASDVVITSFYLLLVITVMKGILSKFLPAFQFAGEDKESVDNSGMQTDFTGFTRDKLLPLLAALGISLLIFGIGGGLTLLVPKSIQMVIAILTITTLGILCSFISRIRKIEYTFQLGYLVILIFSLVVSSMADLSKLLTTAPTMLIYVSIAVFLSALIHILLSALFRVDTDTHLVTSIALVNSPPFVPMVAAALRNREVIVSGVLTGILGWVVGNYLGISVAYALKAIFL